MSDEPLRERAQRRLAADGTETVDTALLQDAETIIIPVIEEGIVVQKRVVRTGIVRISKQVHEHEELVDEPLRREQVAVERVAINALVAEAPEVRQEGDVMIIPVVEEVLVVEKRLLLREEIHVRWNQQVERETQRVTLRREEVVVERVAPSAGAIDGTESALEA